MQVDRVGWRMLPRVCCVCLSFPIRDMGTLRAPASWRRYQSEPAVKDASPLQNCQRWGPWHYVHETLHSLDPKGR